MRKLSIIILTALLALLVVVVTGCTSGTTPTAVSSSSPAAKTGAPAILTFVTQPGGAAAGSALSTQPVIAIKDSNGNTVTSSVLPVRLTITSGTGASGASLLGSSTVNAVNGVARFNNLFINKAGTGYTITATSGNLTPAISIQFTISPGAAGELTFTIQPSGGVAGSPFTTQPEVIVQDNYGNTITDYNGSVTIGITYGLGPTGAVLSGTTTIRVVNGVARFTNLSIDKAYPQNYTLTVTSDSLSSATSSGFTMSAGAPAKLEITVQPAGAKAGEPFETQPKVAIEDNYGNVVTSSRAYVTFSITPGSGTAGAILSGSKTLIAGGGLGGLAEFTDLSIDRVGSGYTLTASCNSLTPAITQPFNVAAP